MTSNVVSLYGITDVSDIHFDDLHSQSIFILSNSLKHMFLTIAWSILIIDIFFYHL